MNCRKTIRRSSGLAECREDYRVGLGFGLFTRGWGVALDDWTGMLSTRTVSSLTFWACEASFYLFSRIKSRLGGDFGRGMGSIWGSGFLPGLGREAGFFILGALTCLGGIRAGFFILGALACFLGRRISSRMDLGFVWWSCWS